MWSLNHLPVFKNLIHKIVRNEMELNSYRSSCHRFIRALFNVGQWPSWDSPPVNKLPNWIGLSTTHCLVVINLLQPCGWMDGGAPCMRADPGSGFRRCAAGFRQPFKSADTKLSCMRFVDLKHHLSFFPPFFSISGSPSFHPDGVKPYFI